ncbi:Integral membrane sensor signal transduction histidine kinase [Croceitalea dokdonensis DOKDO 023]|uniref:histidine kinase n=1 Tax=Croceitalea dokdonensis DOKDO 023 TaxID=1300341 RepID=A0A0P7AKT3_9FLAO|nr:HAMP domain-containing sensor histidine kinase [Croceitalea dokdonensis]KPM32445.1 Integral membrane sensor signal transduction histidine kinase [Croceitalea dokdonensis DOKDO 023]
MKQTILSNRLIRKLVLAFMAILVLAGIGYTAATIYLSNNYFNETTQRLHANLAQDLIDEKFVNQSPIDSSGTVNKALFGDIMHDMMAVNRAIEVYLLDTQGYVQYSVVLDHDAPETHKKRIDLAPVKAFIAANGVGYFLGDDPKNPDKQQVFSAAKFKKGNTEGYIYIVLAGADFANTRELLFGSYVLKLGVGTLLVTLLFAALLGFLSVWYLTKTLRELVFAANRFQQGDLNYRIANAEKNDLAGVTTTYNRMADTILRDMERITSLETMRRELIANISHDLRTPLAIIQGYIETLQMKDGSLTAEQRKTYLDTINSSSGRLAKLISQLFEYSKLEANQIEPKPEPFLISELANDIHRNYQGLAQKKLIDLQLEMDHDIPLVFGDISLVERAIQNLMDNALKFTPNGGKVTVSIEALQKDVAITIKDSGPGILSEHQALIFERYRQTKSGKQNEGSGLGLAIVKKIMELHNSNIHVFSKPNEGTAFTFNLPLHQIA